MAIVRRFKSLAITISVCIVTIQVYDVYVQNDDITSRNPYHSSQIKADASSPISFVDVDNKISLYDIHPGSTVIDNENGPTIAPFESRPLKGIIVYAKQRTGSSFANSMFFAQSNVFTVFEPLNNMGNEDVLRAQAIPMLRDVLQCNFTGKASTSSPKRNKWFREVVLCNNKQSNCRSVHQSQQLCKQHGYVAAKIITLPHLSQLQGLMQQGYHVIHLVRDPRGMINSIKSGPRTLRTNFKSWEEFTQMVKWYCDTLSRDLIFGELAGYKGLPYILLRYEDIASDPIKTVTNIYSSLGLEPDAATMQWMKSVDDRNKNMGNYSHVNERAYSVVRNLPSEMTQKWRTQLQYDDVVYIQDFCGEVMVQLGYKLVEHEAQLGNFSFNFLAPVPEFGIPHA